MALTNAERQARYRARRKAGESRPRYPPAGGPAVAAPAVARRSADAPDAAGPVSGVAGRAAGIPRRIRDRGVARAGLRARSVGPGGSRASPGGSGVTAKPPATSFRLVATTRRCRAHQHDRVLADIKARRFAPPPLRGADGLDAGCAHGPGLALPDSPTERSARRARNLMC